MENKLVSAEQLEQVTRYARAVGIDLHEAVLQKKIAPSDAVMMAYAESVGQKNVLFPIQIIRENPCNPWQKIISFTV